RDQIPALEVRYVSPGESCQPNALREALQGYERVLLYLGFRFDDVPRGFDDLVVEHLKELGVVEASRRFANWSRAVIVDLRAPAGTTGVASPVVSERPRTFASPASSVGPANTMNPSTPLPGCLGVLNAQGW